MADGSAFFFFGSLRPQELANFNVNNVFIEDGGVIEMIGPRWGLWWGSTEGRDYAEYDGRCDRWMVAIVGAYYLSEGVALQIVKEHWVEALDVDVREAVLGFNDDRYLIVPTPLEDLGDAMHRSITTAATLLRFPHLLRATSEALQSGRDRSDESLLSAFRALECVRRHYDADDTPEGVKSAWRALEADLRPDREPFEVLRAAAIAVRHGDRAATPSDEHAVNAARPRRDELIAYSRQLVAAALERAQG